MRKTHAEGGLVGEIIRAASAEKAEQRNQQEQELQRGAASLRRLTFPVDQGCKREKG